MSLCLGDTLEFPEPDGIPRYRIVESIWTNRQVVLRDHTNAAAGKSGIWKQPMINSVLEMGAKKVSIDPIGRVRPARD
jgi:CRISPR-associated endonuclease Csn1